MKGWTKFVNACKLCLKMEITPDELNQIERLFSEFVVHYEKEYYQREIARLPATLISFHYLLHIAKSIRNTGPSWATWQYPMERLCGMLLPLVRSRQHPYINLTNQITIWNQFSHLQYFPDIKEKIFDVEVSEDKKPENDRIFWCEDVMEIFLPPKRNYNLNNSETTLLRHYYMTALELQADELEVFLWFFPSFFLVLFSFFFNFI